MAESKGAEDVVGAGKEVLITSLETHDIRFPTKDIIGDAMNLDPDYSAAYCILYTNVEGLEGHGLTFTIGRGNDLCCAAIESLRHLVVGKRLSEFSSNMGAFWKHMTSDTQLRWVGPEKGVIHLATAAVVNAVWDLWAKHVGKPVWRLVCDLTPEQFVDLIDYTYITDVMTREQALELVTKRLEGKAERAEEMATVGLPAYTTSAGWLGLTDDRMRELLQEAVDGGLNGMKMKVGTDLDEDIRRLRIAREVMGPDRKLMIDANQRWDVEEAIEWTAKLKEFDIWWVEEPTSPDDILGHARIRKELGMQIATGEHCHNRVMFKQLLQAGSIDFCQIDSCRLGGVNEVLAVMLMAAKFGVPVCPHAGGVGLCEYVQHLSMINYVCISGTMKNTVTEYVDHLHEHFLNPCIIKDGNYTAPTAPGYSIELRRTTIASFCYPDGVEWQAETKARLAAARRAEEAAAAAEAGGSSGASGAGAGSA